MTLTQSGQPVVPDHTPDKRITTPYLDSITVPHEVTYASDIDGRYIVGVRLANRPHQMVWVYRVDYEVLTRVYSSSEWLLLSKGRDGRPYVGFYVSKGARRILSVARAIVGEHAAASVRFADGDPFNLRRNNLCYSPRGEACRPLCT